MSKIQPSRSHVPVDERSVLATVPGAPWWAVILTLAAFTVVGALASGANSGSHLGMLCLGIGAVVAVLAARNRALFTAMVQPPLMIFIAVPLHGWLSLNDKSNTSRILFDVIKPLVDLFPWMFWITVSTCVIGGARLALYRRATATARNAEKRRRTNSAASTRQTLIDRLRDRKSAAAIARTKTRPARPTKRDSARPARVAARSGDGPEQRPVRAKGTATAALAGAVTAARSAPSEDDSAGAPPTQGNRVVRPVPDAGRHPGRDRLGRLDEDERPRSRRPGTGDRPISGRLPSAAGPAAADRRSRPASDRPAARRPDSDRPAARRRPADERVQPEGSGPHRSGRLHRSELPQERELAEHERRAAVRRDGPADPRGTADRRETPGRREAAGRREAPGRREAAERAAAEPRRRSTDLPAADRRRAARPVRSGEPRDYRSEARESGRGRVDRETGRPIDERGSLPRLSGGARPLPDLPSVRDFSARDEAPSSAELRAHRYGEYQPPHAGRTPGEDTPPRKIRRHRYKD